MATTIDQHDLQGNILCSYNFPQGAHLFCRIDDATAARAWLAALAPRVTDAVPWAGGKPESTLNIALSYAGIEKLGVGGLDAFPAEFRAGMAARAERLRDGGADAPANWDDGLDDRAAHILVSVHARDGGEADLAAAVAGVAPPAGVAVLATEQTRQLAEGREHFGFSDGLAQPAIDAQDAGPWHGHGTPEGGASDVHDWKPLAPGEFVLGYRDEDGDVPAGPQPFERNASYMVVRKLEQHVDAWERQLREWSGGDEARAEQLGAKVVGRWRNGTPVATSPERPDPALDHPLPEGASREQRRERFTRLNDFRFGGDPKGHACPVGSHVRRANPRDSMGDPALARRHRMIRRGMPYGEAPANRLVADGASRGLFFVCYQASIARQFELVQGDWLRDGDAFGLGADGDALMSPGDGSKLLVRADRPHFLAPHERTVTLRGGGYFLVPSISALQALSKG